MTTNQYRSLFFVAIALLLVAITALITISLKQQSSRAQNDVPVPTTGKGFSFISNQLNLSPDQQENYKSLVDQYQASTSILYQQLYSLQHTMADELTNQAPDTNKLNTLADELGFIYSNIRKATGRHILAVKHICTTEQSAQLGQLYRSMIDETTRNHGQGNGQRKGQGQGRNRYRHGRNN